MIMFTKEEQIKLELFQFIKKFYKKYKNIYSISIVVYPSKIYKRGKLIEEKCSYKLSLIIQYNKRFFYIHENNCYNINIFHRYQNNNIYLKFNGFKLNYDAIYQYFIQHSPLNKINIDFLAKEKREYLFTKNKLNKQIRNYEGLHLLMKKQYKFYQNTLKSKNLIANIKKI